MIESEYDMNKLEFNCYCSRHWTLERILKMIPMPGVVYISGVGMIIVSDSNTLKAARMTLDVFEKQLQDRNWENFNEAWTCDHCRKPIEGCKHLIKSKNLKLCNSCFDAQKTSSDKIG